MPGVTIIIPGQPGIIGPITPGGPPIEESSSGPGIIAALTDDEEDEQMPYKFWKAIAANDSPSANLDPPFEAIFVGTGGHVPIVHAGGTVELFKNVPNGTTLRVSGVRVNATNLTAADMLFLR